jgi:hypothetical protein
LVLNLDLFKENHWTIFLTSEMKGRR